MNTGEKLAWLTAHACDVSIRANYQRGNYTTVAQEFESSPELYKYVPEEMKAECIRREALVEVHVYPATPVGSLAWYHYDITAAIDEAYDYLSQRPERMFRP